MKYSQVLNSIVCLIFSILLFSGCISLVINNQSKLSDIRKKKAIEEVKNDPFPIRIPTFNVETSSPCPVGFAEYMDEDFKRNISTMSSKSEGRVLMILSDYSSQKIFTTSKDSFRIWYTMYVLKNDSTCIKTYTGYAANDLKQYVSGSKKKSGIIHPIFKTAYQQIRSELKNDAEEINNLLMKK